VTAPVLLRGFPVLLYLAFDEQASALLREYVLRGLGRADQSFSGEEAARARGAQAAVARAVRAQVPEPDTATTVDLRVDLAGSTPSDFGVLQGILDDAVRLARAGELLTLPSLPEIVGLRDWICEEMLAQPAGAEPTPWRLTAAGSLPDAAPVQWPGVAELAPDQPWLVGDDHNRLIAASPAALDLLGWTENELVGQRILVVIPPALRERHLAGFTRSVVGGGPGLLGRPLAVPAWTRDGREVPIRLTLTRHPARYGRTVYLARLDPAG
jgi:PAS domain S-box-containing protein